MDNRNTVSYDFDNEWVRLGHYENDGLKERGQIEKFESYGGIIFSPPSDYHVPYTDYSFFPQQLCTDVFPKLEVENRVIMAILQSDSVEAFNIIWLNPQVVKMLGLTPEYTLDGFVATNNQGEPVLKMRTWLSDYVSEGYHSSISDEIPINSGTDLVIRKDYFVKLKTLFEQQPHYLTLRKSPNIS